jgi:outer membrane biosynthesis protein TonB
MQIILESIQELKELASLIGEKVPFIGGCGQAKKEDSKADNKPTAEKVKKDKVETKKEEQPKVEEKREEAPKVEAEVTGVDETPTEPPKDAEVTEESKEPEVTNITKEMVRAICSKAIKAGKSAEVKNIVSKYGASKLPDLKEECYADAYKDVEALL